MHALPIMPTINACLNATSAVLLVSAHAQIKKGAVATHRKLMLSALASSSLFLACYLWYHAHVGSVRFVGPPVLRSVYLTILLTHTVLAAVIVPMILVTLRRGLKMDVSRHRAIARVTYPLWVYVSITGVVIYGMLYLL